MNLNVSLVTEVEVATKFVALAVETMEEIGLIDS